MANLKCMRCNHELILSGNFMLSEIQCEELPEDEDAIVTNATCPYCGASYDIYDTPECDRENYPYFKEDNCYDLDGTV